jgi:glycosyltransferase involved in cell wall biosynthesis
VTVTCVLPVHNGARFLAEALDSVLDQEGVPGLGVVVVDDGSTDSTPEILEGYAGRIRVIRQDNAGVAAARNRGLAEVSTEFVAFQDADDVWLPGKLRKQLDCFEENPALDLCVGLVQNFWMDEVAHERALFEGTEFAAPVAAYGPPLLVARASAFERVGLFDPDLEVGEDNDWFLRAREAGLVEHVVPELLLRRRRHRGSLTRSDPASRDALLRNMKASLDRRRSGGSD